MGGSVGRFLKDLFGFGKPLPTSLALMVGDVTAPIDDPQEHRLRRAMKAASEAEQPVPASQEEIASEALPALDAAEADDDLVLELPEDPPVEAEAPPLALDLDVAMADFADGESEIEPVATEEIALAVEDELVAAPDETVPEEMVNLTEVGDIPLEISDLVLEAAPDVAEAEAEAEAEALAAAPEAVAQATYELSESQADPSEAEIAAADESEAPVKKAPKKKAAAKKAAKKKAAPRKRKEVAPTDDEDDDAAPVEGPASFDGTVEASAP